MRNIAIIEDDGVAQKMLCDYLKRYGSEKNEQFACFTFGSAEQFLTDYRPDYDVVFMDIELPGMNGMEASRRLREIDGNIVLVFVTNMAQFAVGGYEVGAFDFILKPLTYSSFFLKFTRIMQRVQSTDDTQIIVRGKQYIKKVFSSCILYVEIADHDIVYHTSDGNVESRGSMRAVEEQLKNRDFVLCNQCYLVNLKYVSEIRDNSVKVGKDWLTISRPKKKSFLQAVADYYGKHEIDKNLR